MVKLPIRVFVVDDQALVRRGLVRLLGDEEEIEIVGEAEDGVEALRRIPGARPQVVLVDARMPRMDGVELIGRLSEEHPDVAAIILTTFDEDEYVFGGLRAGAKGYLLKDTSIEELVSAIVKASKGETILGSPIAARLVSNLKMTPASGKEGPSDPAGILSNREVQVAGLVGRGATNAEIARALFMSEGTARNHASKILQKLGFRDRTRLAVHAAERGWTERPPKGR